MFAQDGLPQDRFATSLCVRRGQSSQSGGTQFRCRCGGSRFRQSRPGLSGPGSEDPGGRGDPPIESPLLRISGHRRSPIGAGTEVPAEVRRRPRPRDRSHIDDRSQGRACPPDVGASPARRCRDRPRALIPDSHLCPQHCRRRGAPRPRRIRGGLLRGRRPDVPQLVAEAARDHRQLPSQPDHQGRGTRLLRETGHFRR